MADLSPAAYQRIKAKYDSVGQSFMSFEEWRQRASASGLESAPLDPNYKSTTPSPKEEARRALLKDRIIGKFDPANEEALATRGANFDEVAGLNSNQLQALWRNRALARASAQPEDVAGIALRDAQTGMVTRARRGSRKESMMFGDFNAMPPMGASSLLGG